MAHYPALVTQRFPDSRERRQAILELDAEALIRMVRSTGEGKPYLYQCTKSAIPDDADVVAVEYDVVRARWLVLLDGPSLPLVTPGATRAHMPSPETYMVNLAPLVEAVNDEGGDPWKIADAARRLVRELEQA